MAWGRNCPPLSGPLLFLPRQKWVGAAPPPCQGPSRGWFLGASGLSDMPGGSPSGTISEGEARQGSPSPRSQKHHAILFPKLHGHSGGWRRHGQWLLRVFQQNQTKPVCCAPRRRSAGSAASWSSSPGLGPASCADGGHPGQARASTAGVGLQVHADLREVGT